MTNMPAHTEELAELEERFWLEGGGNPDFWLAHFADDGLVALPFGLMDKVATVQAMRQAERGHESIFAATVGRGRVLSPSVDRTP